MGIGLGLETARFFPMRRPHRVQLGVSRLVLSPIAAAGRSRARRGEGGPVLIPAAGVGWRSRCSSATLPFVGFPAPLIDSAPTGRSGGRACATSRCSMRKSRLSCVVLVSRSAGAGDDRGAPGWYDVEADRDYLGVTMSDVGDVAIPGVDTEAKLRGERRPRPGSSTGSADGRDRRRSFDRLRARPRNRARSASSMSCRSRQTAIAWANFVGRVSRARASCGGWRQCRSWRRSPRLGFANVTRRYGLNRSHLKGDECQQVWTNG